MEFTTSADGTKIAFERRGSGEAILLVHGTTGSTQSWGLVASILAEQFSVTAMDRRAMGRATLACRTRSSWSRRTLCPLSTLWVRSSTSSATPAVPASRSRPRYTQTGSAPSGLMVDPRFVFVDE
jgi:pimeloyl-ACP methyl ester carboxylesterase